MSPSIDKNDAYIKAATQENGSSSHSNSNATNFSGTYPYITGPNAVVTLLQNQNEVEPPLSTLQHRPAITKVHVPIVSTEFLVVGAGPSGAALASFLGQNGLKGMVIAAAPSTADTPRAHTNNPQAMECLRDIGIEVDAMALGSDGDPLQSHRWAQSMVGTEYGKIKYWGGSPENAKNVSLASPSRYLDLPQTLLEPLLVKYAALHGFPVRFSTQLTSVHRDEETGKIICGIEDLATTATYEIHTKYIFGADGGRSTVARSFGFTFNRQPSQGVAVNIVFNADLGSIMRERHAQLHWIMRPDTKVKFGMSPVIRMVRPWTEWMLIVVNPSEAVAEKMSPHNTELIDYIKELIGVQTIDIEILRINGWVVRETVAEHFSNGSNVHILGDAAHRHPPAHGLGSNTSIQDAYNLAWKTAYVAKGHAGPGLLDSFSQERQPVGAKLVREANQCYREHLAVWRALGMLADTPEEGARQINELYEDNEAGNARREELYHALQEKTREGEAMGLANNDFYVSNAVYLDDETEPRPEIVGDHVTTMQISTYPGSRLPHAWLDLATREKEISTHDLAGHGHFTVFYGRGGLAWGQAARSIAKQTGIPIKAYGIGFGLDYHDVYRRWHEIRGVDEDGVLVVRPDRFVAWRAKKMVPDATEKLSYVLDKVLSRDGLSYASLQ